MAAGRLTVFDLLCKKGQVCWSPNVNKVRLVLNFKKIPYDVQWLDFPDIESGLSFAGALPGEPEPAGPAQGLLFTQPTVRMPNGRFVRNSFSIAKELAAAKPQPDLPLSSTQCDLTQQHVDRTLRALMPQTAPRVRDNIVTSYAKDYWLSRRERLLGQSVDSFVQEHSEQESWEQCESELRGLLAYMQTFRKSGGPFMSGESPIYADFIVVAMLHYLKQVDEIALFDGAAAFNDRLGGLYQASEKWLQQVG